MFGALASLLVVASLVAPSPQAVVETVAVAGSPCGDSALGVNCRGYFPDLVEDPTTGDLLLVYRWSSEHAQQESEIRLKRSTNGGVSWSAPTVVAKAANTDYRDPSIAAIRSGAHTGRLLLSYFVANATTGASSASRVRYKDPSMASFSGGTVVTSSNLVAPYTTSKVVPLANGQVLMPVYGTPVGGGPHRAAVIVSVDGGVTFDGAAVGRQKTVASSATLPFQEPAIEELQPGHVQMLIRTTGVGYQSDSYDNTYMSTWTAPFSRPERIHAPELVLIPGTNLYPVLWSEPNAANTLRPVKIKLRRFDVLWENTPTRTLYTPSSGWDAGYSSTVPLSSTQLITAVYDESRRAVLTLRYGTADVD